MSDAAPLELREVTSGYGDVAVIRGVSMDFHRERLEFFVQPGAGTGPYGSERNALRAVLIATL